MKDVLKKPHKILRIKKWFKGAHATPNRMVGLQI